MHPLARRIASAVLLLGTTACTHLGGTPVGEVAEFFTMGRSRHLQKPLRPVRGETRVLIFALDGVGRDALHEAIRAGRMPELSRLLGAEDEGGLFAHAYSEPEMLSILPSTTISAWASIFTGAPPAQTGIPGNEWFVREEARFYAPVPVTVLNRSHAAKIFTDEFISKHLRAPTLYERLPPVRMHVSMNPVYRGADLVTFPDPAQLGDLVGAIVGETLAGSVKKSARVARETDESSVGSLLNVIDDVGLPDVQTVYFNGIDLLTHYSERPLEEQQRYLETVTDPLIGKVLEAYRSQGALDRTYVVVVADHGHTPVLPDDRNSLSVDGDDEPPALLRHAGFRTSSFSLSSGPEDAQAMLAYQGFFAFVYLADRSTCAQPGESCDWSRPPRLEEDVLPAVRAFDAASREGTGVPALRGTLDLILARVPAGSGEYHVYDGERLVPLSDHLRRHPRPDLLRFQERLAGLTDGPAAAYAGDVLLLARSGHDRPVEDRYYFADPQYSEHGSPHPQDSRVPLIVAHPSRSGAALRATVREVLGEAPSHLDVAPLVQRLIEAP